MPFFAVIIPIYNRFCLADRSLLSVLRQNFHDFECVVIDDGSQDFFEPFFQKIVAGDTRFRCVRNQKNRGVSAARNVGVALTSAPWIAFLDSDDEWMPDKLLFHHRLIVAKKVHLSESGEVWMRHERRVNPANHHLKSSGDVFAKSLQRCALTPSSVVVSRQAFLEAGGFDEKLPVCEDYDLWLRLSACHPLHLIKKTLTIRYQGHAEQLSFSGHIKDIFRIRALCNLLKYLKKKEKIKHFSSFYPQFANKEMVIFELKKRCAIVAMGAKKRGVWTRFFYYRFFYNFFRFFVSLKSF